MPTLLSRSDKPRAPAVSASRWSARVNALRVTEVFCSLQGEARDAGRRTTFVRLTGCPLRCRYCDTAYAFHGGDWTPIDDIVSTCERFGASCVCVTGGEPLAQPNCALLVERLCERGFDVSVETSGALDIRPIDRRASRVVDLKTPDSGEVQRNEWRNIEALSDHDQLKFVLCSRADYDWARRTLDSLDLPAGCAVWFSPSADELDPAALADWMIEDATDARLQLQLHKQLWGNAKGR